MSRLEKLAISGIRSFSPAESNVIVFNSPLTLIVGENGTGKTTIIESLKYATTGNFPPNTKGGAFVYDPAIIDQIDAKAEIKLRFTNNANEQLSCCRVLQVFQRGGRQIQKTLETSLYRESSDERALVSARLAEIDQLVPEHLGVSQPLLDGVIFCHQEESTWPIGEPRILKERLDQIFDSAKYIKALKSLKEAKKGVNSDVKLKSQSLEYLLKEKDKKEQIQRDIQKIEEDIASKNSSLGSSSEEGRRLEHSLRVLKKDIEIRQQIDANFRIIKTEFDNCKNYIKSFAHAVLEDAQVEALLPAGSPPGEPVLEQYRRYLSSQAAELESGRDGLSVAGFEDDYHRMEQAASRYLERAKRSQELQSTIAALKDRLAGKEDECTVLIEALRTEFNVSGPDIFAGVRRALFRAEGDINTKKIALQQQRDALMAKREQRACLQRALDEIRPLCEGDVDPSLDPGREVEIDHGKLVDLEAELYELEERHAECQAQLQSAYKNTELNFRRTQLEREYAMLRGACEQVDVAELREKIESLENKRQLAERELRAYQDETQRMQLNVGERQGILSRISDEYGVLAKKCVLLQEASSGKSREAWIERILQQISSVEFSASSPQPCKRGIVGGVLDLTWGPVADLLSIPGEALAAVEPRPVSRLEKEIEDCRNIQKVASNASAIYKNFLALGKQKSQCPLCKTELSQQGLAHFASRLERVVLKLPEEIAGARQKEETLAAMLNCVGAENAEIEKRNGVKDGIRKLKMEAERLVTTDAVEKLKYIARRSSSYPERLRNDAMILDDISHMLAGSTTSEFTRMRGASIADIYKCSFECAAKIDERREQESRLARLKGEMGGIPAEAVDLDGLAQEADGIGRKIEEKREAFAKLSESIREKEGLKARVEEARAANAAKARMAELEDEIKRLGSLEDLEDSLKEVESAVASAYDAHLQRRAWVEVSLGSYTGINRQIAQLEEDLSQKQKEMEPERTANGQEQFVGRVDGEVTPAKVEMYMLGMRETLLRRKDEYIRVIGAAEKCKLEIASVEENIKLRRIKERALAMQSEISTYDFKGLEQLREKLGHYEKKRAAIAGMEASLRGELKQLNASLTDRRNDLAKNYAEVGRAYSKCVVHLRALELGAADIDRCVSALDHAIAEFHASKIDEVNTILQDLWTSTYRGNDIEYIELRAEVSDTKAYSYSVVMVKNGSRMEMRGRCSAGQKMIASILIRLAMADSFSSNCNILALDEPTTNLDRANVESLASTLARLIKERTDVQLIVISHDEEFIELLSREGVDYFYRLKRDMKGNSHIEKHSMYAS